MIFIEAILSGIWATFVMDILAKILARRKLIHPFMRLEELGRWFFYMFRGKLIHRDISNGPALKHEKLGYYVSHYLIGIFLAGFYLMLADRFEVVNENNWLALVFGILTVVLPWCWLLPVTGFGFMAAKSSKRVQIIKNRIDRQERAYQKCIEKHGLSEESLARLREEKSKLSIK
jgi:hypothetical protein